MNWWLFVVGFSIGIAVGDIAMGVVLGLCFSVLWDLVLVVC